MRDISSFSNWNRFLNFSIYKQMGKLWSWWRDTDVAGRRESQMYQVSLKISYRFEGGNSFSELMGKK